MTTPYLLRVGSYVYAMVKNAEKKKFEEEAEAATGAGARPAPSVPATKADDAPIEQPLLLPVLKAFGGVGALARDARTWLYRRRRRRTNGHGH